jgi:hypothetical protein
VPPATWDTTTSQFVPAATPQPAPEPPAGAEQEDKTEDVDGETPESPAPRTWQEAAMQGHLGSYAWKNAIKPGLTALYTDPLGTAEAIGSAFVESISAEHMYESCLRAQGIGTPDGERDMMPTFLDTLNIAGAAGATGIARAAAKKAATLPVKSVENSYRVGHNAPVKALRPFEADYPKGAKADASGRLLEDIEGRPLNPDALVAGRRYAAGVEEALRPEDVVEGAARLTGKVPEGVARSAIPGRGAGAYLKKAGDNRPERSILFDKSLPDPDAANVIAHEFAHAIDDMAGRIPTDGLNAELRQVYNTLATGRERTRNLTGPQHLGYSNAEAPAEMMAEAIRAYIQNPNYLKTVAPKTAAAIRKAVNGNPRLSKAIQFNALGEAPELFAISFGLNERDRGGER